MTPFVLYLSEADLSALYTRRLFSIRQIAVLYGVSQTAIRTRLMRMGVTR